MKMTDILTKFKSRWTERESQPKMNGTTSIGSPNDGYHQMIEITKSRLRIPNSNAIDRPFRFVLEPIVNVVCTFHVFD